VSTSHRFVPEGRSALSRAKTVGVRFTAHVLRSFDTNRAADRSETLYSRAG
jgi:hypothetical protein